jgi:hypothetical protein
MMKTQDKILRMQIATFNLIGALAEKLVNEKPIISVELKDKDVLKIEPTTSFVTWNQEGQDSSYQGLKENPKDP